MRAQVVSFLMAQGITEGNAMNNPTNSKKVIIVIKVDHENRIKEIKEELVKHLNKLHKNDFCYKNFPSDITASELFELDNPPSVSIIKLNILANSLMLEQTSKGVGAMKYLADTLKSLEELPNILKALSNKLK